MTNPRLPALFLDRPIAHRGLHNSTQRVAENSRAAARAAIAQGYGIECDVQLSSDGVAMVFHDTDTTRLTGHGGRVRKREAVNLSLMRLLNGDEGIPTLADFLTTVDGQAPLLIELKDQTGTLSAGPDDLERAVAADLASYGGPVAVMSFNPHMVAAFGRHAPDIPRGHVTDPFTPVAWPGIAEDRLRELAILPRLNQAAFISHNHTDLDRPEIAAFRASGRPVLCWTIRSFAQETAARQFADNITFEGYSA
ncbi:MAG: glycerophosphodiester phosphodiesterase family protein [Qingshengfaniella sp.]